MSKLIGTDTFHEVWSTITNNRRRSLLTAFGVFWGIFMLVVMLSMGNGITNAILGQISYIPKNMTLCWTSATSIPWQGFRKGRWWEMKADDMDAIRKEIPELLLVVPEVTVRGKNIIVVNKDKSGSYRIKGVDGNFSKVCPISINDGRYINEYDVAQMRKVCVMGQKIVDEVYKGVSPVGSYVMVGGVNYQCVGIAGRNSESMNIGGSDESVITIPYTVVQKIYNLGQDIDILAIQAPEEMPIGALEDRIREIICSRHHICPEDEKALTFMNIDQQLKVFLSLCTGITALLWIVGLGTLLSGAIGVSNIVMITVKERTREIGVRRAIGAGPGTILAQIMAESLVLTSVAGLVGFVCGVGTMSVLNGREIKLGDSGMSLLNPMIDFNTGIAALVVLVLVGLAAGILPARRALKIKAIDAIREE